MKAWYEGKTILITGATDGIGRELARRLSGSAALLILVGRSLDKFASLAFELDTTRAVFIPRNMSDVETVEDLREWNIDAFVNCVGGTDLKLFEQLSVNEIRATLETNLTAPIIWLHHILPTMKPGSRVVLMSSRSGERALTRLSIYTAAKAAIERLADALRNEYVRRGISFTVISPGSVQTAFTRNWTDADRNDHNDESIGVDEAVEPILMALSVPFAVNKVSYESFKQWRNEPGVLK